MCPRRAEIETDSTGTSRRVTAVQAAWRLFDAKFAEYKKGGFSEMYGEQIKGELTGMSQIIFLMMRPYYESRDDIVREVMARHEDPDRRTPGIGSITMMPEEGGSPWGPSLGGGYTSEPSNMIDPPYGYPQELVDEARELFKSHSKKARDLEAAARARAKQPVTKEKPRATGTVKRVFTEEELTGIRNANSAGFDYKMIMAAYNCTMEDLKGILLPD